MHNIPFPVQDCYLVAGRWIAIGALAFAAACSTQSAERAPELADTPAHINWAQELVETLPPLTCAADGRWPMILWEGPGFSALPAVTIKALIARGIVPHVRLDASMIPAAKAIQDAGGPVIIMEGENGGWGYGRPDFLVPADISAWRSAADSVRTTLTAFRDGGITVNAVWLDYEVEPLTVSYHEVQGDPAARQHIPEKALASPSAFAFWKRQLWTSLMSAYVAGPVREVFPAASVTNWMTVVSTRTRPVPGMISGLLPPTSVGLFTATNPVAYGTDTGFWQGGGTSEMDRDSVDRRYTALILNQVSTDAANRRDHAPHIEAFPWVGRWIPLSQRRPRQAGGLGIQVNNVPTGLHVSTVFADGPAALANIHLGDIITRVDETEISNHTLQQSIALIRGPVGETLSLTIQRNDADFEKLIVRGRLDGGPAPVMSRERYREALRHLWLRGITGMQVFNSATPGHAEIAVAEVEDAQSVYDEMLANKPFLANDEPINLEAYDPENRVLWSGLRWGDEVLVRVVSFGGWAKTMTFAPWPGSTISLPATALGQTWLLRRDPTTGLISKSEAPTSCR